MRALVLLLVICAGCGGPGDTADPDSDFQPDPCSVDRSLDTSNGRVALDLPGCAGFVFERLDVVGQGELQLELYTDGEQLVPKIVATSSATFEALHLSGTWWAEGEGRPALWRQGYQSRSPSGVFPLTPIEEDGRGLPLTTGEQGSPDEALETPFTSWWAGLVGRPDGGSVLVGTLGASRTKTWVAAGPKALHLVWGGTGEAITLEPGEAIYLDPAWFAVGGTPGALWRDWARAAARARAPRVSEQPPTGWASGSERFATISEEDVRANLAVAAQQRGAPDRVALDVIQIDDGWARSWGDWTPNNRFPSGLEALAAEITAEGFVPGIWMAPFLVSREAPVYEAHPDWWVRDARGQELDDFGHAVLDVTHPDAGAWMAEQVRARVQEGFGVLKLDLLHVGAVEGQRRADVTGAEAYAIALGALREAAGDAWLVACGAPMLPSLGWVDSWQSGPDIAVEGAPGPEHLRSQARSTAATSFLNGLWWWNDAAPILVGEAPSDEWAHGAVVIHAVSGGAWMLGDDLVALPDHRLRLALHADAASTAGAWSRPVAPLSFVSGFDDAQDAVPTRWELSDGTVALLNPGLEPVEVEGPGGTELLTGGQAAPGPRTLQPGRGELWRGSPGSGAE